MNFKSYETSRFHCCFNVVFQMMGAKSPALKPDASVIFHDWELLKVNIENKILIDNIS